ncbi:MAG: DUF1254 domain-containing protein [Burkholderiales bacterium]|nr:DUF1254 domain-containing protein [Burkholderiales bacterium]
MGLLCACAQPTRASEPPPPADSCRTAAPSVDLLPRDPASRGELLRAAAFDATIYGMPAVLQYEQLYRQAWDRTSASYTGFNRFRHERTLAGPDYATFRVPNSDTLYSTAWIDLGRGPVEIDIPPTTLRYFTLNIFDIFGNPDNLSNRTIGFKGGRFLLVPPGWDGSAPAGVQVWHAGTVQLWILMRAFAQSDAETVAARAFQDQVRIIAPAASGDAAADPAPPMPRAGALGFLAVLDHVLRVNGCLPGEEALVSRFHTLGVMGRKAFDPAALDATALAAIDSGYQLASTLIGRSKSQLGMPAGTGWMKVEKGHYGYDYVRRAVTNAAGLGANVREENASYTAFVDGDGKALDGATARYRLKLTTPPPVDAFWSVTLYDARTFALYPNALHRYLISDRTAGLRVDADGAIEIAMQHEPASQGNWLPAPSGPFFVVIRAYGPQPPMLTGQWLPPAIAAIKP